jgi:hypothetical protein
MEGTAEQQYLGDIAGDDLVKMSARGADKMATRCRVKPGSSKETDFLNRRRG